MIKKVTFEQSPEPVQNLVDFLNKTRLNSINTNKILDFVVDLDENTYWIEENSLDKVDNENEEIEKYDFPFIFIKCISCDEEKSSGIFRFKIFPDGTVQPVFIYIENPQKEEIYTLFLNPYTNIPEIFTGEVTFEKYEQ